MDYRAELAALRARRDAEIRRLAATALRAETIAKAVGCSGDVVREILDPDQRTAHNERRCKHAQQLREATAAA